DSQRALDAGALPTGTGDIWHANWTDIVDGIAWVSLCHAELVVQIDVATGKIVGELGKGGDYALTDTSGQPLSQDEWFQCQHGLDVLGDKLLVYDNGVDRHHSRVAEYTFDTLQHTAQLDWTWPNDWYEMTLGDADWLPNGHLLVNKAHAECISSEPGSLTDIWEVDQPTGDIVWTLEMGDIEDASYRAERVDSCALWQDATYCDATR